ncbi:DUF5677 domain-containing protein [Leptospira noguchii]|uniref:Uncharacterized protein n=1 Tax=Leptospira noguchii serovar Panama str. CZ214 TaxID=1001595 RepID=T0FCF2_9LEPT|nr:DUF5677 domain-containing protein [Leptospira noguchii]EQA70873.1 hypothetical protein LEP1GSC059_3423 [Leptospira noguchii serovar Panama str. CZ214]
MDEVYNKINQVHETYLSHKKDLDTLARISLDLVKMNYSFRGDRKYLFKNGVMEVTSKYILNAICEFNSQIIIALEGSHYSSAEALSRISIEHSVNLRYILNCEKNDRAKSLLKHYLFETKAKAVKWKNDSIRLNRPEAVPHADKKISLFDDYIESNPDIVSDKVAEWPDAKSRFRDIGEEYYYHIVYASASNSVHTLSEDIFNILLFRSYPLEIKKRLLENVYYQKMSFAFYLSIFSLIYSCASFVSVLTYLENTDLRQQVEGYIEELRIILERHEQDELEIKEPI